MKKIFSLIIICALLIQTAVFEVTAKTYDVDEAKELLVALGIVQKYDYEDDEELLRSDFASLAVRTINKAGEALYYQQDTLLDVTEDDKNSAEMCYLDSLGIMKGDGNGYFRPYDKISIQEAVTVVVRMLNYGFWAEQQGGYPGGYMNVASELDLTKGIGQDMSASLTANDAYILLKNALNAETIQLIFGDEGISYNTLDGETLLYTAFECKKGKGVVTANDKTTLSIEKKSVDGTVVIGGKTYNAGTTDIGDKLGYYVTYYTYEPKGSDEGIIITYEIGKNSILELSATEILDTTTLNEFVYEYNNRTKIAKVAPGADIIYNGIAKPGVDLWQFIPDSGKVTLFDTNNDDNYDIIKIDSYINYVLESVVSSGIVVDKYSQKAIDLTDERWEEVKILMSGKEIASSDLKQGDILSVSADIEKIDSNGYREIDFDNAKYLKIDVTREQINGVAERVDKTSNTIQIGTSEYSISENLLKLVSANNLRLPIGGQNLTVKLDVNGMIADIDTNGFSENQYGYLVKTYWDTDEEPPILYLSIYNGGDRFEKIPCREKFKLDGVNGKSEVWEGELAGNPQFISFKTNANGLITNVDTKKFNRAYEDEDTSIQDGGYYESLRYKSVPKYFQTTTPYHNPIIRISGETKVFSLPAKSDIIKGDYSIDDFGVVPISHFLENKRYNIEAFNLSKTMLPEFIITYSLDAASGTTDSVREDVTLLVEEAEITLNEYDEIIYCLSGYNRTTLVNYTFKNEKIASKFLDQNGNFTLNRGDVVFLDVNEKNQITGISMSLQFSDNIGDKHDVGGPIDLKQVFFGMAYVKDKGAVVTRIDGVKSGVGEDILKVTPLTGTKPIALYDASIDKVSIITMNDILCENEVGTQRAYLLRVLIGADGEAKDIIAYKLK